MAKERLQDLPVNLQDFETLRRGNYLYIDKTQDVYELARPASPAYFLSRPRRFGKSMLCSTFRALFSNKKELFKDTWIGNSNWEWKQYPIIYLSMDNIGHKTPQILEAKLQESLAATAKEYGVRIKLDTPGDMLKNLILQLEQTSGKVVLLVDEYDKPLINNLDNIILLNQFRTIMKELYGCLKDFGSKMRFLFITGVSRFSMVSIFSDLNHLKILSDSPKAATLCGYTQAELEHNFSDYLKKATAKFGFSREQMLAEIKHWYNGYCFVNPTETPARVYNPFSITNFFDDLIFKNYWFSTGTTSFVINYFKEHPFVLTDFEHVKASATTLDALIPGNLNLTTMLYQTGYLTIDSHSGRTFTLSMPNQEVRESCAEGLLNFMQNNTGSALLEFAQELKTLFQTNKVAETNLMTVLKKICTHIPYTIKPTNEKGYQLVFYLVLQMTGLDITVEEPTALGRIDAVIAIDNNIFILELKIKGSATKALRQVVDMRYAEKYLATGKSVTCIGAVFDTKLRTMTKCQILQPGKKLPAKPKTQAKIVKKIAGKKSITKATKAPLKTKPATKKASKKTAR